MYLLEEDFTPEKILAKIKENTNPKNNLNVSYIQGKSIGSEKTNICDNSFCCKPFYGYINNRPLLYKKFLSFPIYYIVKEYYDFQITENFIQDKNWVAGCIAWGSDSYTAFVKFNKQTEKITIHPITSPLQLHTKSYRHSFIFTKDFNVFYYMNFNYPVSLYKIDLQTAQAVLVGYFPNTEYPSNYTYYIFDNNAVGFNVGYDFNRKEYYHIVINLTNYTYSFVYDSQTFYKIPPPFYDTFIYAMDYRRNCLLKLKVENSIIIGDV